MPNKTKKTGNRKIIYILAILIIAIGIVIFFTYKHYHKKNTIIVPAAANNINYSPSSPVDNIANNNRKASSNPSKTLDSGTTTTPSVPLSVSVTRASILNSNLQVGTIVNGTSSGSCTVNVSQSGQQTITQTENITLQNNAYACPVFNIPLSKFPNSGKWDVSVTVNASGSSQTSQWQANPVDLSSGD